jgi:hypothetical protein
MDTDENVIVSNNNGKNQRRIAVLIGKSFYLCRKSEQLLNEAKDMRKSK